MPDERRVRGQGGVHLGDHAGSGRPDEVKDPAGVDDFSAKGGLRNLVADVGKVDPGDVADSLEEILDDTHGALAWAVDPKPGVAEQALVAGGNAAQPGRPWVRRFFLDRQEGSGPGRAKIGRFDRLREVIGGAEFHDVDGRFDRPRARDHDDGGAGPLGLDGPQQVEIARARHLQIGEDEVVGGCRVLFQGLFAAQGDVDFDVRGLEGLVDSPADGDIAGDDEDLPLGLFTHDGLLVTLSRGASRRPSVSTE